MNAIINKRLAMVSTTKGILDKLALLESRTIKDPVLIELKSLLITQYGGTLDQKRINQVILQLKRHNKKHSAPSSFDQFLYLFKEYFSNVFKDSFTILNEFLNNNYNPLLNVWAVYHQ